MVRRFEPRHPVVDRVLVEPGELSELDENRERDEEHGGDGCDSAATHRGSVET